MKILITTDLYTTATNGVVTSVRNLWDELKHRGHDVRILTLSDKMHSCREDDVYYIRSVSLEAVYPNVRMPMTYRHHLLSERNSFADALLPPFIILLYADKIPESSADEIQHRLIVQPNR